MQIKKIKKFLKKREEIKREKQFQKLCQNVRNKIFKVDENLKAFGEVEIYSGENISIGKNCKVNSGVLLNGRSGIAIGDDVTISHGAKIISTGYDLNTFFETGDRIHITDKPIEIGNHCWIGAGAIILAGVNITGEYVIVGAGAVVTKDITESRVLVAGNPAKIVKRYD